MRTGENKCRQFSWRRRVFGLLAWALVLAVLLPTSDAKLVGAVGVSQDDISARYPEYTEENDYIEEKSYVEEKGDTPCDPDCMETDADGNMIRQESHTHAPATENPVCNHEHNEYCGYSEPSEGSPCTHVHDDNCGYVEGQDESSCTHKHDENCGYVEPSEGSPCAHEHDEDCSYTETAEETESPRDLPRDLCIIDWEWVDEEGFLTWNEAAGLWGLGLPGVSEENIVTRKLLADMLPKAVTARTAAGTRTVDLEWDYGVFPEEGAYEGEFTLTAELKGEYVLTETANALEVALALGGGEPYANYPKFLNQWSFIARDESKMSENQVTAAIEGLGTKTRGEIIQWLEDTVLPTTIRGWVSSSDSNNVFGNVGFVFDTDQSEEKSEMTENGWDNKNGSYDNKDAYKWGRVRIKEWNLDNVPQNFLDADEFVFSIYALTPHASAGSNDYYLYVNSNNPDDYKSKDSSGNPDNKDTSTKPDILSLTITLRNIDFTKHTVPAANPENVTVNLFDYWVKTEKPTTMTNGDILDKPNQYYHEEGAQGAFSTTPTGYSSVNDWNKGINIKHLLLFGDGMIHAGLWNKGAGENCRYGNTYAGMEGIVKNILPENGYPELNLSMADKILTGDNARDYTLIKDYRLTGDFINELHPNNDGYVYDSSDIQNLSKSVITTWGGDIGTDTESLRYLFDPEDSSTAYKTSYTDVKGLFQLDKRGYYYYNMRENFAEFVSKQTDGDKNHFILYDAPATLRTDGVQSVGNFFPFNKGSEVFNGVDDEGKLTSTVACSGNSMNHHLGMTVSSEFRQPANGLIHTGEGDQHMTFEFAGDDDVWVFIDDVLVLDLGGIHSELYGTIDFATGEVYIGRAFDSKGIPDDPENPDHMVTATTLLKVYRDAGMEDKTKWTNNTFASNTSHTLKMFYLERGNYDSSIALRFNLQPLLYQRIVKVDQNGNAVPDVEFELCPARKTDHTDAIQCLYTDAGERGQIFYVEPDGDDILVTLKTDQNGSAVFLTDPDTNEYFNFADRGDQYYILKETKAPKGYRRQPIDIVLHYDPGTSMLSVANRWSTGAYACSTSNVTGAIELRYGELKDGKIRSGDSEVSPETQENGLVVTVPLLRKTSDGSWMALYGSNMGGFNSIPIGSGGEEAWRNAALRAALEQAGSDSSAAWHLDWDDGNRRLFGTLNDLPGLASRYLINDPNGDMDIVYGIIAPEALDALGISGDNAGERYAALKKYIQDYTAETAFDTITRADGGNGFRFLSVDQFNRDFRSLVYIPNERRELWVMKVDQDGKPLAGTEFGLYDNERCGGNPVASGFTDSEGRVIFSPTGQNGTPGQAKMVWADSQENARYFLKEMNAPAGYRTNPTVTPVVVGTYSIYADAGAADDGVSVMAGVGRLTQTMRQYAMDSDVDITLQDITAFMQTQPSNAFQTTGWQDAKLEGTDIVRRMNLHFGKNAQVDYGLHDEDGGRIYKPFFVTDTGFVCARARQNYQALTGAQYEETNVDANKENLGDTDLTNLFSLLNMVVVTDRTESEVRTGKLIVSKKLTGSGLTDQNYLDHFRFLLDLRDAGGVSLSGSYYYFYGDDKAGLITSGEELLLHHDESVTILGLPEGAEVAVTEQKEAGWYPTPASGTVSGEIDREGTVEARFTNSPEPGNEYPKPDDKDSGPDNKDSRPDDKGAPSDHKSSRANPPETLADAGQPAAQSAKIARDASTGDADNLVFWALSGSLSLLGFAFFGRAGRRGRKRQTK